MIEVRDVVVQYDRATVLDSVSLDIKAHDIVALIGPNGAGKTTLVNALAGVVPVRSGAIRVGGRLATVPENRQLFSDLSVEDNLALGAWRLPRRDRTKNLVEVQQVLPQLARVRKQKAGTLSGGQQQMVAIGRALMADPEVLVVDELSLGLAPLVVADLAKHLKELNEQRGLAILLIEQNAKLAFDVCRSAYILENGHVVASGPCEQLVKSEMVLKSYLGMARQPVPERRGHPNDSGGD